MAWRFVNNNKPGEHDLDKVYWEVQDESKEQTEQE